MNKKGFTLIELLAVITILGLISLIAIPGVGKYIEMGKNVSYKQAMNTIKVAAQNYTAAGYKWNYNGMGLVNLQVPDDHGHDEPSKSVLSDVYINGKKCHHDEGGYDLIIRKEIGITNSPNKKYLYNIFITCGEGNNMDYYVMEENGSTTVYKKNEEIDKKSEDIDCIIDGQMCYCDDYDCDTVFYLNKK